MIPGTKDDKTLYAIYDLNVFPASFDLCWFLIAADIERKRLGLHSVHIVIAMFHRPFVHAMPPEHSDHVDEAAMLWRVDNILQPLCSLLPTCDGVTITPSMPDALRILTCATHVWPAGCGSSRYPTLPQIYRQVVEGLPAYEDRPSLKASEQALRYVRSWFEHIASGHELITITLRQHRGGATRNNDLDSWIEFARRITNSRFLPVFVPDTELAMHMTSALDGFTVFQAAPWNIALRMALYEAATLNLFVNNGPASLAILNGNCRYLMFKVTTPSLHLTSENYLSELGFREGRSPPFAGNLQKWVWEDDTREILVREFDRMMTAIDLEAANHKAKEF